jgi:hypothetical protein
MVWKILAATLAMIIAIRLIIPQVRKALTTGRYPILGILGGVLFGLMFACVAATLFIEDDKLRQLDALLACGFAVTGAALLLLSQMPAKK